MSADEFETIEELDEAKELLEYTYHMLCNLTTEQFRLGADKTIRNRIAEFLGIEEE